MVVQQNVCCQQTKSQVRSLERKNIFQTMCANKLLLLGAVECHKGPVFPLDSMHYLSHFSTTVNSPFPFHSIDSSSGLQQIVSFELLNSIADGQPPERSSLLCSYFIWICFSYIKTSQIQSFLWGS